MKILVTGAAGFIGFYVCKGLLNRGDIVVGLDNINTYYDVSLKYGRLSALGIQQEYVDWYKFVQSNVQVCQLPFYPYESGGQTGYANAFCQ